MSDPLWGALDAPTPVREGRSRPGWYAFPRQKRLVIVAVSARKIVDYSRRRQSTVPKGGRSRQLPTTQRLTAALKSARHLRSDRVLCLPGNVPITRDRVIKAVRSAQRAAGLPEQGVHILLHTFCSHLAMRGAPARAIQGPAGHADLSRTTQRYMHLSPAATEDAIRLLDTWNGGPSPEKTGDILDTGSSKTGSV